MSAARSIYVSWIICCESIFPISIESSLWPSGLPDSAHCGEIVHFQGQCDAMLGNSHPTQMAITHALEFTEHCQKLFAIICIFVRKVEFFFPGIWYLFYAGLIDSVVLFNLGVFVNG